MSNLESTQIFCVESGRDSAQNNLVTWWSGFYFMTIDLCSHFPAQLTPSLGRHSLCRMEPCIYTKTCFKVEFLNHAVPKKKGPQKLCVFNGFVQNGALTLLKCACTGGQAFCAQTGIHEKSGTLSINMSEKINVF